MNNRFDPKLYELIPHRPPMLLINQVLHVDDKSSSSLVFVDHDAPFYEPELGIPSWIGLEYMGQTAALIAGHQLQQGMIGPHLGFLLGTRKFTSLCDYFQMGTTLKISCVEKVIVGDSLATFDCLIENYHDEKEGTKILANASLSVLRREIN